MSKLKKYKKKKDKSELSCVEKEEVKTRILQTIDATECFVFCTAIAMELTLMLR